MFGFYISLPFLLLAIYRLIVVLINYFTRPFLSIGIPNENPLVSVFVYAQNSEKNIGRLVQRLKNQEYQNLEILIYNDQSSDRTVGVIGETVGGDKRFRLFNGNDVQNGWQRRNHAFDKLTQLSKGRYYIFIDDNVNVDNLLISNAVSHIQQKGLSLLAVYPKRNSENFWERICISSRHWLFFSLVSVKSFLKNRGGEFSILDGPVIIVESGIYQNEKWHERFKDDDFPEHKIVKAINDQTLSVESLLGDNRLTSQNTKGDNYIESVFEGIVNNKRWRIAFAMAIGLSPFLIVFLMPFPLVFLYFFFVIYGNMLVALLCQESVLLNLLLLPAQFILLSISLIKSILKK